MLELHETQRKNDLNLKDRKSFKKTIFVFDNKNKGKQNEKLEVSSSNMGNKPKNKFK